MAVLAALAAVDWVVAFSEDTPERLVREIRPDVLVKGGDYRIDEIAGADFVRAQGGEVRVIAIEEECSTSAILRSLSMATGDAGRDR
jgi:D-beta-D-heptose 7-phosphate kinase/D-beta-D-heptose 1-phosphate adenosyltransferase